MPARPVGRGVCRGAPLSGINDIHNSMYLIRFAALIQNFSSGIYREFKTDVSIPGEGRGRFVLGLLGSPSVSIYAASLCIARERQPG